MLEIMKSLLEYKHKENQKIIVIVFCNNPEIIKAAKLEAYFTFLQFKDTLTPGDADFLTKRGVALTPQQKGGKDKVQFGNLLQKIKEADWKLR